MRKLFAFILIALLLGVGVVAIIETDPGYVLIAYDNYTLETSLWVGLVLFVVATMALYGLIRLLRKLFAGQRSLASWVGGRKARRATKLTTRGLINYIEGNWVRARRQLLAGARKNEAPLLNYLIAARASYQLGETDKMREYLGQAEAAESQAGIAIELTQAELKLAAGQYEQALATLVRARRNAGRHPHVLDLLRKAYTGLNDWQSLASLLPELKKHQLMSADAYQQLEYQVYAELLRACASSDSAVEALHKQWQATPATLKRDSDLLQTYVQMLVDQDAHSAAEKVMQRALKQDWSAALVEQYGLLEGEGTHRYLVQAENWLTTRDKDATLLLAAGRLACREKLWGKAREYFENAYRLQPTSAVCAELGRLLTGLGEPRPAAAYYREGLLLAEGKRLPELPAPQVEVPRSRQLPSA